MIDGYMSGFLKRLAYFMGVVALTVFLIAPAGGVAQIELLSLLSVLVAAAFR